MLSNARFTIPSKLKRTLGADFLTTFLFLNHNHIFSYSNKNSIKAFSSKQKGTSTLHTCSFLLTGYRKSD